MAIKKETAYHEAGHALAAYRLGFYLGQTSIIKKKHILGFSSNESEWGDGLRDIDQIIVLYAGLTAEQKFNPNADESGSTNDNEKASSLLKRTSETESSLRQRAKDLINDNWQIIQAIAEKLLIYKTLEDDELSIIIDSLDEGFNPDDMFNKMRIMRKAVNEGGIKC